MNIRLMLNTQVDFVSVNSDTGNYATAVGSAWADIKRVSGMDDETATDKYSITRYKATMRVPGNFTPLAKHRVNCHLRSTNGTRQMRILSIGQPDLRGHWLQLVLEDNQRDN